MLHVWLQCVCTMLRLRCGVGGLHCWCLLDLWGCSLLLIGCCDSAPLGPVAAAPCSTSESINRAPVSHRSCAWDCWDALLRRCYVLTWGALLRCFSLADVSARHMLAESERTGRRGLALEHLCVFRSLTVGSFACVCLEYVRCEAFPRI
ncbi:hypothetical protein COO60DRAFT_30389 [Scenedesmus sp. NREL 46B-D3]|nr:hypothetical protein COO60DRAFT_30389 [Scenedesmus sp. NREL 46B-D3]